MRTGWYVEQFRSHGLWLSRVFNAPRALVLLPRYFTFTLHCSLLSVCVSSLWQFHCRVCLVNDQPMNYSFVERTSSYAVSLFVRELIRRLDNGPKSFIRSAQGARNLIGPVVTPANGCIELHWSATSSHIHYTILRTNLNAGCYCVHPSYSFIWRKDRNCQPWRLLTFWWRLVLKPILGARKGDDTWWCCILPNAFSVTDIESIITDLCRST